MVVTGSLQASYRGAVRKYGFEGEAGREGEGATRTHESSYRRVSHGGRGPEPKRQGMAQAARIYKLSYPRTRLRASWGSPNSGVWLPAAARNINVVW